TACGGPNAISLVRIANMQRLRVGLAVYSHRLDSHFTKCSHHTNRDFATIGNQYFLEHLDSLALVDHKNGSALARIVSLRQWRALWNCSAIFTSHTRQLRFLPGRGLC